MAAVPHPDSAPVIARCAIVTISDSRTPATDRSGQTLHQLLQAANHQIVAYTIQPDEPKQIQAELITLSQRPDVDVIIFNGGTGIAPRDTTYDAIAASLDKTLPGFGELFRWLSYQEIGSRAMTSRAIAGTLGTTLIFSLPGSTHAVILATEKLILPELAHLLRQLQGRT